MFSADLILPKLHKLGKHVLYMCVHVNYLSYDLHVGCSAFAWHIYPEGALGVCQLTIFIL